MSFSNQKSYQLTAKAIQFLRLHFNDQPSLEQLASRFGLSPSHFQRLFRHWVGLTPKQFLQQCTTEHANQLLRNQHSCLHSSYTLGLSGSSRLYDHCVSLDAVTPGELKSRGQGLTFYTGEGDTPLGKALINWTERGIHTLRFKTPLQKALSDQEYTQALWPKAKWEQNSKQAQTLLDSVFSTPNKNRSGISLWVKGTNFQIAVWRALLEVPEGALCCYGHIAAQLGKSGAGRAVGGAVANNPVAILIPCHRVIRNDGGLGGYRWGIEQKKWILAKELLAEGSTIPEI